MVHSRTPTGILFGILFRNPVNEYMKNGSVGNFKLNDNDNLIDSEFESKPPNRAGVFRMVYG